MKPWEVARYLIDAKKDIDSMMYIDINLKKIPMPVREEYFNRIRDHFYINCCVVVDAYLDTQNIKNTKNDNARSRWKEERSIIERIYHERDKNSAHIDDKYEDRNYNSAKELVLEMKQQLKSVKRECEAVIPSKITLDFVAHDRVLFRLLNKVDYNREEELKKMKHTNYQEGLILGTTTDNSIRVLTDIKQIRGLSEEEKKEFGVVVDAGINSLEGLQNRQDYAIKCNVLWNADMWVYFNEKDKDNYYELKRLGFFDNFDIPRIIKGFSNEFLNKLWILSHSGVFDE